MELGGAGRVAVAAAATSASRAALAAAAQFHQAFFKGQRCLGTDIIKSICNKAVQIGNKA